MSDSDVPAGEAGGRRDLPEYLPGSAELPERLRVHALARLIEVTSREVLDALDQLGAPARGAQSSIDRDTALRVIESLAPGASLSHSVASDFDAAEGEEPEPAAPVASTAFAAEPAASTTSVAGSAASTTAEAEPAASAGTPTTSAEGPPAPASPASTVSARTAPAPPTAPSSAATPPGAALPLFAAPSPMFLPPEPVAARPAPATEADVDVDEGAESADVADESGETKRRRRRGRRGRGRGRGSEELEETTADTENGAETQADDETGAADVVGEGVEPDEPDQADDEVGEDTGEEDAEGVTSTRRRRRRRRRKDTAESSEVDTEREAEDLPNTVTRIREPRKLDNGDLADASGIQGVRGSTRLEAKRQRRRDGRDAGRRRAPVLSEAEFLARRESVERTMVVRQHGERSEIGVLEDGVLVEHFVTSSGGSSLVGNVYLGRVQNVLPSMEAAFVDIGRGRNAVLYAGEVDWDAAGLAGKARRIEQALSSGDNILVQVTKDPVGHKGARLTTQISLPGRFLVYVPSGGTHGISRKLPDTERRRLKDLLREIVPEDAGVIIRTASEGVSQEALERDVRRLQAQWEVVKNKAEAAKSGKSKGPELLYEEPDLMIKVVRDQFNEDFAKLVVQGDDAWDTLHAYVSHVAPELADRLHRHVGTTDVFAEYRIDEQLMKALDRKVWLPSGGTLVIDRTEAMTVIDVNTGKFTGSGGNLEETVTRNNLEAAEEIVRQLRLRDIGGIIVIDFIDMVLESNRDLVLRRLTECLGRDRTRHQVAEVTSLGLVQMTRKRVGMGLLEAFSTPCEHCRGRGVIVSSEPVEPKVEHVSIGAGGRRRGRGDARAGEHAEQGSGGNGRRGRGNGGQAAQPVPPASAPAQAAGGPPGAQAAGAPAGAQAAAAGGQSAAEVANGHSRPPVEPGPPNGRPVPGAPPRPGQPSQVQPSAAGERLEPVSARPEPGADRAGAVVDADPTEGVGAERGSDYSGAAAVSSGAAAVSSATASAGTASAGTASAGTVADVTEPATAGVGLPLPSEPSPVPDAPPSPVSDAPPSPVSGTAPSDTAGRGHDTEAGQQVQPEGWERVSIGAVPEEPARPARRRRRVASRPAGPPTSGGEGPDPV